MAHTIKNKSKLIARVRRIKGQVEAVERALEAEIGLPTSSCLSPRSAVPSKV